MKISRYAVLHLLIFVLLSTAVTANENVFTVGVVPQFEARKLASIWTPILDKLSEKSGYEFTLSGSSTIAEFEKSFMAGEYDFVYLNPYHLIVANELQGYLPICNDKSKKLRGVLVVRKDSPITNVTELNGKNIAFPSPNALGASLQMRQELHDLFQITFTPVYVKTHDSVYLNVLLRSTAAGGGVGKTLKQQKQEYQDNLRIIHETTPVSPHPIAVHPRVPSEAVETVTKILLEMGTIPEDSTLLAEIPVKKVGASTIDEYTPLQSMKLDRFYVKPE